MIDCGKKNGFHTFTFYKCISISNPSILRQRIRKQAANLQIIGTIMLTEEGINSTISSLSQENLNKMITLLEKRFGKIKFRKSFSENKPFKRLKVKVRKEIVPSGTNVSLEKKSSNYVGSGYGTERTMIMIFIQIQKCLYDCKDRCRMYIFLLSTFYLFSLLFCL